MDFDKVFRRLEGVGDTTKRRMADRMEGPFGAKVTSHMKANRPWTDRTGAARASIHTEFSKSVNIYSLAYGIGVYYGKYLELSNGGKYRVVGPTGESMRREFMTTLRGALAE